MKIFSFLTLLAFVLVTLLACERAPSPDTGLPWQIETFSDGTSRVFGLTLARSTLADARQRFGQDVDIGIIAPPKETGTLEAYYYQVAAGPITGRIILVADLDQRVVAHLRARAVKSEYMESATRRYFLRQEDLPVALAAPIATLTFIPSVNLDERTVLGRFGAPSERVRTGHVEHFLYPDRGLDLALDDKDKEVLQYVAPRDFARLRAPLMHRGGT